MINQDTSDMSGSVQNEACGLNMFLKCILKISDYGGLLRPFKC